MDAFSHAVMPEWTLFKADTSSSLVYQSHLDTGKSSNYPAYSSLEILRTHRELWPITLYLRSILTRRIPRASVVEPS